MIQLTTDGPRYDDRHYLRLAGRDGLTRGESLKISLGEVVVVGRSRACDLSLKKTPRYLCDDGERARIQASLPFRATSRRHVRLAYVAPDVVEVTNLSPNGTLVDGFRVDRVLLTDVRTATHEIRLGAHGDVLVLACGSVELDVTAA
ncbi:MAG: FHA domain-containing protein [Planctomycetota bacterium]